MRAIGQRERRSHMRQHYQITYLAAARRPTLPCKIAARTDPQRGAQTVDGEVFFAWSMSANLTNFPP